MDRSLETSGHFTHHKDWHKKNPPYQLSLCQFIWDRFYNFHLKKAWQMSYKKFKILKCVQNELYFLLLLLSFLLSLPTLVFSSKKTWNSTLSLSPVYDKSQSYLFPILNISRVLPFLSVHALVQALIHQLSDPYNSLLFWFFFCDLTWLNLFSHQSSHAKTQIWPYYFSSENTSYLANGF